MVQLWVNLPAKDKMAAAGYQGILSADVPAVDLPEVLSENRFLAARDGSDASLIDARRGVRAPVPDVLESVLRMCTPHAEDLGCVDELQCVRGLVSSPRPARQVQLGLKFVF